MHGYSTLDRFLHRLALQFLPLAELSFALDQIVAGRAQDTTGSGCHIFVSGLARSGTTILMRRLHASGELTSLTYRNMPFVLAPNLWSHRPAARRDASKLKERAHGDGILVDEDSPESLDEVFWRTFCGDDYIHEDHLTPHVPDRETITRYCKYVHAILVSRRSGRNRYLSKNNNNILRLGAITTAFPGSQILVPFRDPVDQAASLLRQHRRFCQLQDKDPFVLTYMNWLAHHEFGQGHRPFRFDFDETPVETPRFDPDDLTYWIDLWTRTYGWLETHAPAQATFVCYEDLCTNDRYWKRLAELTQLSIGEPGSASEPFRLGRSGEEHEVPQDLLTSASTLYGRLAARSRAIIS